MAGSLSGNTNRRGGRRRSFRPSSDINVTPLVDVMLVLLIIFMVTAPILTVGVPVDLPKTTAAQTNDTVEPIVISINDAGKTFLKETEMDLNEIIVKLRDMVQDNQDAKIYVRGDKKLTYGQIMEVMGVIASSGFQRVSLIAEMPSGMPAAQPMAAAPTRSVQSAASVNTSQSKQDARMSKMSAASHVKKQTSVSAKTNQSSSKKGR